MRESLTHDALTACAWPLCHPTRLSVQLAPRRAGVGGTLNTLVASAPGAFVGLRRVVLFVRHNARTHGELLSHRA